MNNVGFLGRENKCPFCGRKINDMLKHFRISHDIEDMDQLSREIAKLEIGKNTQAEFGKYVEELKDKENKGLISVEDYRRLVMDWVKQNT